MNTSSRTLAYISMDGRDVGKLLPGEYLRRICTLTLFTSSIFYFTFSIPVNLIVKAVLVT